MRRDALLLSLAVALLRSTQAQKFSLAQDYSGTSFFNGWSFFSGNDPNNTGNVFYQPPDQVVARNLTFVNNDGHAVIKVDNVTNGQSDPNYGRASVYMTSNASVTLGDLVLFDAVHMPFGCSVWPAFFMQGADWPNNGEIDIVENVNLAANNQYALHTASGCTHPAEGSVQETGTVVFTDCLGDDVNNTGCIVKDNSANSFGANFAKVGGGVFATLLDEQGIKIWFFERSQIPSDIGSGDPDPSTWSTPSAFYPASTCNPDKYFGPQNLIIDIDICGKFAGNPGVFDATCNGTCVQLVQIPTNYDDAYFEINYLRVFKNLTSSSSTNSSSASSGSTNPNSPQPTSGVRQLTSMFFSILPLFGTGLWLLL